MEKRKIKLKKKGGPLLTRHQILFPLKLGIYKIYSHLNVV